MKKHLKKIYCLLTVLSLLVLVSCTPEQGGGGRNSDANESVSTGGSTPIPTPVQSEDDNVFIQNGQSRINSLFTISPTFNDSFLIRGGGVNTFMGVGNAVNSNTKQCLLVYFPISLTDPPNTDKVLVLTALPRFFTNFSTNQREYYYQVQSTDPTINTTNCQTPGVLNTIAVNFPGSTPVYQVSDICTTCTKDHTSSHFRLYTVAGNLISEIDSTNLALKILNTDFTNNPGGNSCTSTPQCAGLGFDCCVSGQCVTDGAVKPGVDQTSAAFLQAQLDVQTDSSRFRNYPAFFHVCPIQISPTATPVIIEDPQATAAARFTELEDLHNCLNPQGDNELAICTVTYENAEEQVDAGFTFSTLDDDRTFETTYSGSAAVNPLEDRTVTEIIYGGEVLYSKTNAIDQNTKYTLGARNDTLDASTTVTITASLSSSAVVSDLVIRYQIDGSCEPIGTNLSRCSKFYKKDQDTGNIDDHNPAAVNDFTLPTYADLTKTIEVRVDGIVKVLGLDWTLVGNIVRFTGGAVAAVSTNQIVELKFFVASAEPVSSSIDAALTRVDEICSCGGTKDCNLTPVETVTNGVTSITDYRCVYPPPPVPTPPLQQTVNMSAKTIPVRFFDTVGGEYERPNETDNLQEGTAFEYTNSNFLKPNNYAETGNAQPAANFNEIYGSITTVAGSPQAPSQVAVVKGKTYDIFTDRGSYSSCITCGTDYFDTLARLFPSNFVFNGAGYKPDPRRTDPFTSDGAFEGDYRAHDLIFGRACFLPATMIPWTHQKLGDVQQQRQARQSAQHFLFANGYNRDWYGFDYGSVIGSWDGVKWFAVGSERRIIAESNKLFLAINSYFGDLTQEGNFRVTINETTGGIFNGTTINNSFNSSGAECQQFHVCSDDKDCLTQLGPEYVCATVTDLKTNWPKFDANGSEVPGDEVNIRLVDLLDGNIGGPKRCVYRGRGAPCAPNLFSPLPENYYSQNLRSEYHTCSSNNYCQSFNDVTGANATKFNNRIARFARSQRTQNFSSDVPAAEENDTFGLAARIIGRPYRFNGTEEIEVTAEGQLNYNLIEAICIPGREPFVGNAATLFAQHTTTPSAFGQGDRVNNLGNTRDDLNGFAVEYLNSCGVLDENDTYFHVQSANALLSLADTDIANQAGGQYLASNMLRLLEANGGDLLADFDNNVITEQIMQENRCLRAPGASCNNDFECAPNTFIAEFAANISPLSILNDMNPIELAFWQEGLVCGQKTAKDDPDFDLTENKCCREVGNTLTIGTDPFPNDDVVNLSLDEPNIVSRSLVPGIDYAPSFWGRNSRMSTAYTEMKTEPATYPNLQVSEKDSCDTGVCQSEVENPTKQWKTFDLIAQKTCCTNNWVRNFHETNGGGHTWGPDKMQNIQKSNFSCMNFAPCNNCIAACISPSDPDCFARSIPATEIIRLSNFLGSLELTGIPQMLIMTTDEGWEATNDLTCKIDTLTRNSSTEPIPGTIKDIRNATAAAGDNGEFIDSSTPATASGTFRLYSAIDDDNFDDGIKQVFDDNEITCCLPSGEAVPTGTTNDQCCTGQVSQGRCCLPDFADVTVYLNRYVSSEASELGDALFDPRTGFFKNPNIAAQIAARKNICCSGLAPVPGLAISRLPVPGFPGNQDEQRTRFVVDNDDDNANGIADLYDEGMKWNTHFYCPPAGFQPPGN